MRLVLACFAVVVAAGCEMIPPLDIDESKLVDGPPNAEEAKARVCEYLGVGDCPRMYFQAPEPDKCIDSFFYKSTGYCDAGITGSDGILLVMPSWATKPSDTAMIHELIHWGRGDYDHGRPDFWGADPSDWPKDVDAGTLVADLYARLVADGF